MAAGAGKKRFKADVAEGDKGAAIFVLPFDPDAAWGKKPRHRVSGTVDGQKIRAIIDAKERIVVLTPMWRRDCGVEVGKKVAVELWPEGPQRQDLAEDFEAAL